MTVIRILCLIAALALLLAILNHLYGFYPGDAYSIAAVVLVPGLFALVAHTPREIRAAFADALARDHADTTRERLAAGASALGALGRYSLATGVLAALWSYIGGLNQVAVAGEAVTAQNFGLMISQASLLVVLGVILRWFVYGPLEAALRHALDSKA